MDRLHEDCTSRNPKMDNEAAEVTVDYAMKNDITQKIQIARKIMNVCKEEAQQTDAAKILELINTPLYTKAQIYLGHSSKKLLLNCHTIIFKKQYRDIKKWIETRERKDLNIKLGPTYKRLRELILKAYLQDHCVPNMTMIRKGFKSDAMSYDLMMHGFVWKRYPGTDKCIIVEDPKQIFERQLYLRKIQECREKNKNIVYVDERNLMLHTIVDRYCLDPNAHYAIMAANGEDLHTGIYYDEFKESILPSFLTETLFPELNEPSVIVLGEKKHNSKNLIKKPDQYSSKADMCHWLEANDVPHNPESHRAELYTLIQRYTKHSHLYGNEIDEICRAHGHELLRRPFHLEILNIFLDFWKLVLSTKIMRSKNKQGQPSFKSPTYIFNGIPTQIWKEWIMNMTEKENKTYSEDMAMEELLDRMFAMARNGHFDENLTPLEDYFDVMFGNENFLKNVAI